MKFERSAMNAVIKSFLYVLVAALASSALGGLFGCVVALISPEFARGLFSSQGTDSIVRYSAAVGMIWGLFMGAGVMGFVLLIKNKNLP